MPYTEDGQHYDEGLVFIPGEDFDPYDQEEVESVKMAMEYDMAERNANLQEQNRQLIADNARYVEELAKLRGDPDDE